MLTATNIVKNYGALPVLRGVDIKIEKGEIVSIVGSSGAGKSTLLHILGTLDKPDKGAVSLDSKRFDGLNGRKLAAFRNKNIGFVFQFHHLPKHLLCVFNFCKCKSLVELTKSLFKHSFLLTTMAMD